MQQAVVEASVLSDHPADATSQRTALVIAGLSLFFFVLLVPLAGRQLGPAAWFIPLNQSVLIVNDLVTATLLFGQWRMAYRPALLALAAAYVFAALMAGVHMLTFPGVFAPTGLLTAGGQSTAYLFIFWHSGFPLLVAVYALTKGRPTALPGWYRAPVWTTLGLVIAGAMVLSVLAIVGGDFLPPILDGTRYSSEFNVARYGQWVVTGLAFVILWRRRSRSVLDLWLLVVLAANFFEIGLVAIFNTGRNDVGFYAGRVYALLASSFVLIMLLNEQGRLYRSLATAQEIARSEAALRESREVLGMAMQGGQMGAWSRHLDTDTAWWSPELEHMLGLETNHLPRHVSAFMERVHPDDHSVVRQGVRSALTGKQDLAVEFRVRHADGSWRWMDARARALYDDAGRAIKLFGIVVDVTSRKRVEEASEQLEARFRTLADGMPQLAWMAQPDGWIYWYNQRWHAYTGKTPQQMEGWGWQSVHDPSVLPAVLQRWQESIQTGEPFEMVFPLRRADGQFRPFLTRVSPLKDADGKVMHWFGTNTDITEQREAEEALRVADRRKDEFLATLAHELRNPLAPIRTAVALIARAGPLPPTAARAHQILDRQSSHLTRLVDDLLEVSRITQGKVHLQKQAVSLAECIREAVNGVRATLDAAGHRLTVELPEDPLMADADGTRITQIVVNLLNNAVKFTPSGGSVSLNAVREDDWVCIRVADSGIGIAAQHLSGVFEMFSQITPAMQRSHGGLGIGLALVRGFVELHGGSVEARSEGADKGSEFIVRLPLLDRAIADLPAAEQETKGIAPRRVLVVDDNRDAASSMRVLLEQDGHEVHEAHDGREALRLAFAYEPEIILLDLGMPGMSGIEVAREIRKHDLGSRVQLIAVTGWGQAQDRRLTLEAGFQSHLTKPIDHGQLDALLANVPRQVGA